MNNYPIWWDQSITIYNRYEDSNGRITWYRHTVSKCFYKDTGNKVIVGDTEIDTSSVLCRIPKQTLFRDKGVWDGMTSAQKQKFFTIGVGDIIVKGIVTDTVNEYDSGKRSSDLLTKYKAQSNCFVVEKCSINVGAGRGMEHYSVRGV